MQINTYAVGFELTPSLRGLVESRLAEALRPFAPHIRSAVVHLSAQARGEAGGTSREIVVSFRATGEERVRTENPQMQDSIERAIRGIRSAVEREMSKQPRRPLLERCASRRIRLQLVPYLAGRHAVHDGLDQFLAASLDPLDLAFGRSQVTRCCMRSRESYAESRLASDCDSAKVLEGGTPRA